MDWRSGYKRLYGLDRDTKSHNTMYSQLPFTSKIVRHHFGIDLGSICIEYVQQNPF